MRRMMGVWWAGCLAASVAGAAPLPRADCDAASSARVLQALPEDAPKVQAQAVWLDRQRLQWPGLAPLEGGRIRLLHAARGGLRLKPGEPAEGADAAASLQADDQPLPPALAERFRHLMPGPRLVLAAADRPRLAEWLRGQLVLVQEDAAGRVRAATAVQLPGALDDVYAAAGALTDLGATFSARGSRLRLWAPTARQVALCLYPSDTAASTALLPLRRDPATGSWQLSRPEDLSGRYAAYLVDVFVPGLGLVRNRVTDPYARSLGADSRRQFLVRLEARRAGVPGWSRDQAPGPERAASDMVVYELHVRDFSVSDASVPPALRGKYLAFTQEGSQGMRHLSALAQAGLTDVHLLPVFDFGSVPERGCVSPAPAGAPDGEGQQAAVAALREQDCFNWGYDPVHYSAPEGSYATDAADGSVRVREFRRMVMALHRAGLRVGMDVVYNHTFAAGQQDKSVLDRIVPGYYHRLDAQGQVERSTCCDNTASEHLMMGKLVIDSVRGWARDFHIDSFRFDLMGHQPRALMERLQQALRQATGRALPLIGEGWNFGEVADGRRFVQASQLSLNGSGIGSFSDRARDALRGGGAGDGGAALVARQGYLNGLGYARNDLAPAPAPGALARTADLVRVGLAGSLRDYEMTTAGGERQRLDQIDYAGQPAGFASQPSEVVNYAENHDNQTLFDTNVMKLPRATSREDRARVQVLAAAVTAFSQGVAYFHAGQDLLRSKSLDRNSFNSGDWFNRLDWSYQRNHFGTGLPPQSDNGADWPWMRPLLADPALAPTPADIAWTRDAFRDLLRIRASTRLLRLQTAEAVRRRLRFLNTGPDQEPTVLVGWLDGQGLADAGFESLLYLVNVDAQAHVLDLPALQGRPWRLHPVHLSTAAADLRARSATLDDGTGRVSVPARTAVVFVVPRP